MAKEAERPLWLARIGLVKASSSVRRALMMKFNKQDRPFRRCRFIVHTADLSAWGGHRRAIGRWWSL